MAKRPQTFSPDSVRRISAVVDRVESEGGTAGSLRPSAGADAERPWVYVTATGAQSAWQWPYTATLYPVPSTSATALASGVQTRNAFEFGNTTSNAGGYTIVSGAGQCEDITGLRPVPTGKFYRAETFMQIGGTWMWVFHFKNDPIIRGN